jgi:hypothetical protein
MKAAWLENNRRAEERIHAQVFRLEPASETEADRKAYEAARQRLAHLEEMVTENCTRADGSAYVATHPRWLSEAFRREHSLVTGRRSLDAAYAALKATARGQIEELKQQLADLARNRASIEEGSIVGASRVTRWSMSASAAQRGAFEARRFQPLNEVLVTSEIEIVDKKPSRPR